MIFYFSGTSNTKHVAQQLAAKLNDHTTEVAEALAHGNTAYTLAPGESIGFAFPTYAWGLPPVFSRFIASLHLSGYSAGKSYCYMVTTCGDDIGLTAQLFAKQVAKLGLECNSAFSVQMPNVYVCLPGFDVDPHLLEKEKLYNAERRIDEIALCIAQRRITTQVVTGKHKWLKSAVIRPLFLHFAVRDSRFRVMPDRCTHCKTCVASCPMHNITIDAPQGMPQWHGNCTMCLSCLHRCPAQAIQYGNATLHKGRYFFAQPVSKQ